MTLQVLLSTYGQTDFNLLKKMNIQSDALVVNQGQEFSSYVVTHDNYKIQWINCQEKGIGLSRNTALQRATADICLLSDDDVIYSDNYRSIVLEEFERFPQYDMIIFNLISTNPLRSEFINKKGHKVHLFNCLRYGAFRIAIRTTSYQRARLSVSQLFGGGSRFGSGEDSLFLVDCLKKRLRVYASEKIIGTVNHHISTWFSGYNHKYFYDKGALFAAMSAVFDWPLCVQFCIRHPEMLTEFSCMQALRIMRIGAKDYKGKNYS